MSLRSFLAVSAGLAINPFRQPETRQATGVKIGEVTHGSALVWMLLTQSAERKRDGVMIKQFIQRDQHEPLTLYSFDINAHRIGRLTVDHHFHLRFTAAGQTPRDP